MVIADKVAILNGTSMFLNKIFLSLTQTLRMIFDDGRPDLTLRFR